MCIRRSDSFDALGVALTARIAIDTLIGFFDGEKLWHGTEKGIEIILETRQVLRFLNGFDKEIYDKVFFPRFQHYERYYTMQMVKEVCDRMKWDKWDEELEQWLANKENVLEFFSYLESNALGEHRHSSDGCF